MNKVFALFLLSVFFVASCQPSAATVQTAIVQTQEAQPTNTPSPIPSTNTPRPTNTLRPTATYTPKPESIILSGSGDAVIDIKKWKGFAVAHITYNGDRNFIVSNYGSDGKKIHLLVNTVGKYEGTVLVDILDKEQTTRFEIQSNGQWEIQVLPLEKVKRVSFPGKFEGVGDDVLFLFGTGTPDLLKVDASQAERNFIVNGFGNQIGLLINEIAPYTGVVIVPENIPASNGAFLLSIIATGNWSVEVTAK